MSWTGIVYLIKNTFETDEYGVRRKTETKTKVRADISGTTQSEFFEAGRAGLKASDVTITIPKRKYSGEELLEYKGKRLSVYRTYPSATDLLELHCEAKGGTNGKSDTDRQT